MPIYAGTIPSAFYSQEHSHRKPRSILKQLVEMGSVMPVGTMQIVTQIDDLNLEENAAPIVPKAIPSLLHHVDKTRLEQCSLEPIFSKYD